MDLFLTLRLERGGASARSQGMSSGTDRARRAYRPGDAVPTSGIYTVVHVDHREPHDIVAIQGEPFPPCRRCGNEVRFRITRLLPHMTHDFDLAGPDARTLRRKAKAAGEEGS
jgi:hypothetical protein